ncbi:Wnt-5b-like 2, partial [Homarus americanus]
MYSLGDPSNLYQPPAKIGDLLKDKYDGATEVKINRRGKLQVKHPQFNVPTGEDLVYLHESPDYCNRNTTVGSLDLIERKTVYATRLRKVWMDVGCYAVDVVTTPR